MDPAYRNVLAALDLERPLDAPLITGWRLAREQAAELRVVVAVRPALVSSKGFFSPQLVDRDAIVTEARSAAELRTRRVTSETRPIDVMIGDPGEIIAFVAERRSSDLIVIGARPRSGSEHVLGTTATDVLRRADGIDIYACHRPDPQNPTDVTMIAIDGTSVTEDVLAGSVAFLESSAAARGDIQIVCVLPDSAGVRAKRVVASCRRYLQNSPWSDVEVRAETGDVTDRLEAVIRELDADLLIIGSGENLGIGWALGSTTNEVLHEVSCDVLVIRQNDNPVNGD